MTWRSRFISFFIILHTFSQYIIPNVCPEPLKKEPFKWFFGDSSLEFASRFRVEGFFGRNLTLLNNENGGLDEILVPAKYTYDIAAIYGLGCKSRGYDFVRMKAAIRSKGTWGAPETIASTDDSVVKDVDVVFGRHAHTINRHILWIREVWVEANLGDMFGLPLRNKHTFMAGFFPFQLGRGIALGDAYATDPDLLGYYSPSAIDQYAPGAKLTGCLGSGEYVGYDLYAAILHNKSNTFNNVNMRIRAQQFGHRFNQARGFGVINWLLATRLRIYPFKEEHYKLYIEPYVLYDDEREQKIEFAGDANMRLGTFGCAMEATLGDVELGFDFARNVGRQYVHGWDRNVILKEIRNGTFVAVNSDVRAINSIAPDVAGERALFLKSNQAVIDTSTQSQCENGKQIGDSNLKNSNDRFNNPFHNDFEGLMVVGDISYNFCSSIKSSFGAGFATGDVNPNRDLDDLNDSNFNGKFKGFIGLQETYTGTRIRSAFLLSGASRIPRLLSFPSNGVTDRFPESNTRFTNLIFVGWSADIKRSNWNINPNILNYWQDIPTRIFVKKNPDSLGNERNARTWLGTEFNLFADVRLCNDMRMFFVGSLFMPGTHFKDIKGLPLSAEQERFLNKRNRTGIDVDRVPVVGDDLAYTINIGIEYKF